MQKNMFKKIMQANANNSGDYVAQAFVLAGMKPKGW